MGRLAKLLSFVRVVRNGVNVSDVKVDPGGGPNITAEHFASPGDDSHPMPGDYVALNADSGAGREDSVGYLDPLNTPKALLGDKRIYARGSDGVVIVEVWLKNNGTAETSNVNGSHVLNLDGSQRGQNANGSFELQSGGDFVVNGVTIKANGDVIMPGSLVLNGKEIDGHTHTIAGGSSAPGPTGPNT